MKDNVGSADFWIRMAAGALLLGLGLFLTGNARWLILPGGVLMTTALAHWCPLYTLFGASTCEAKTP